MSETPRKPGEQPEDSVEREDELGPDQETADQPTVSLNREEAPVEALLEDEPAEYELPDPAPRPADDVEEAEDPGLPTSDPVFPTASPQLKPPVPADVSGFGVPAGAGSGVGPESDKPTAKEAPAATSPAAVRPPASPAGPAVSSAPASPASPALGGSSAETGLGRPARPMGPPRQRSAAEIRADIEAGRQELSQSVEVLRDRVEDLTDWRGQVRKHRREITIAAAAVGFAVGARFMMRRRRR